MIRVMVVGLGNMGRAHALAHHHFPESTLVALVNRSPVELPAELAGYPRFLSFAEGMACRPDLVVIASYTESHADYACAAMEAGADVFVEKPLAATVDDAVRVIDTARRTGRKLVVGYILRHHPSWMRLVEEARALGGPWVFRFNLNQQSTGHEWETHKALMQSTSPIVDCGVHYVDVMCQITPARPVRVHGIGLRLSDEIEPDQYNYGQLQVVFDDGSVGWYEAGWGPMISETAFFIKDVISPAGAVSIVADDFTDSADIGGHTRVGRIRVHTADHDSQINLDAEPDHQQLCDAEQAWMIRVIGEDINLDTHLDNALQSLRICLAADASIRTGNVIHLEQSP